RVRVEKFMLRHGRAPWVAVACHTAEFSVRSSRPESSWPEICPRRRPDPAMRLSTVHSYRDFTLHGVVFQKKRAAWIPVGTSRMPAASPIEARPHLLGKRRRGGEARRFDAEQVYEPLHAVLGGRVDHEIGGGFAGAGQLGADAGVVGHQRV